MPSELPLSESAAHRERPAFIGLFHLTIELHIAAVQKKIVLAVTRPVRDAELSPSALPDNTIGPKERHHPSIPQEHSLGMPEQYFPRSVFEPLKPSQIPFLVKHDQVH
jgi:hypothetical protein